MTAPFAPALADAAPRTFADIIAELGDEHAAQAAHLAEIERNYDAFSARIDRLVAEWKEL